MDAPHSTLPSELTLTPLSSCRTRRDQTLTCTSPGSAPGPTASCRPRTTPPPRSTWASWTPCPEPSLESRTCTHWRAICAAGARRTKHLRALSTRRTNRSSELFRGGELWLRSQSGVAESRHC